MATALSTLATPLRRFWAASGHDLGLDRTRIARSISNRLSDRPLTKPGESSPLRASDAWRLSLRRTAYRVVY